MTHHELVQRAYKWLLGTAKCCFAFRELRTYSPETPDAIGFRSYESILVECKTSKADFIRDQKKWFRRKPNFGVGNFRYYLCEPGIIDKNELPGNWGLLYINGNRIKKVKEAERVECSHRYELRILYSALRRLNKKGLIEEIYENET